MTDIDIQNRDQIEWIVANDPWATFDVYGITATGRSTLKSYKSLPRNIDRVLNTDGIIVARLAVSKADAYRRWEKARAQQETRAAPTPPPAVPPPQPVRPATKPTLLPKMPLPPHLRREEEG